MMIRIGGKEYSGPKKLVLILPRPDGDIPFTFVAVLDDTEFITRFPIPTPPKVWKVGEGNVDNPTDPKFLKNLEKFSELKWDWLFLKSVAASDIEWTTVKMDEPETWGNWKQELKDAGFNIAEIRTIEQTFAECNTVTDSMLKQARERFFATPPKDSSTEQQ